MPKKPTAKAKTSNASTPKAIPTKHQQVIDLLTREGGATLEAISTKVGWLPHSTYVFIESLKKSGYIPDNNRVVGVRHYRIIASSAA